MATAVLQGAVFLSDTTITVDTLTPFSGLTLPFTVQVDLEQMLVTAKNTETRVLTVTRQVGVWGAQRHNSGAYVIVVVPQTLADLPAFFPLRGTTPGIVPVALPVPMPSELTTILAADITSSAAVLDVRSVPAGWPLDGAFTVVIGTEHIYISLRTSVDRTTDRFVVASGANGRGADLTTPASHLQGALVTLVITEITLASAITANSTKIPVTSTTGLPTDTSFRIKIGNEIMLVNYGDATATPPVLYVTRAVDYTIAASAVAGQNVFINPAPNPLSAATAAAAAATVSMQAAVAAMTAGLSTAVSLLQNANQQAASVIGQAALSALSQAVGNGAALQIANAMLAYLPLNSTPREVRTNTQFTGTLGAGVVVLTPVPKQSLTGNGQAIDVPGTSFITVTTNADLTGIILAAPVFNGQILIISNVGDNKLTFDDFGTSNVANGSTVSIDTLESILFVSDGTLWLNIK